MAAITVILAAFIASYVFLISGDSQNIHQVGVVVKRTSTPNGIMVKTMSGNDIGHLKNGINAGAIDPNYATYTVTVKGITYLGVQPDGTWTTATNVFSANTVGSLMYFGNSTATIPPDSEVTVVAHYSDGTDFPAWSGNLA